MNERQKILDLVRDGKLTPEQADLLLQALEERAGDTGKSSRAWDFKLNDLKALRAQLSSYVSQSLTDVRRTVEHELRGLSTFGWAGTLTATAELTLPEGLAELFVETKNGSINLGHWDEPYARVLIRGQVRTSDLDDATKQLQAAIQTAKSETRWHMTVRHDPKDGVVSASVDVLLPDGFQTVSARTVNGEIRADSMNAGSLSLTSSNGAVFVYRVQAGQLQLMTDNGAIDVHGSVGQQTNRVYVTTKNGTIDVEGLPTDVSVSGLAKSASGRVHVTSRQAVAEFVDPTRNTYARLSGGGGEHEVHIHCETKNGAVHIRD